MSGKQFLKEFERLLPELSKEIIVYTLSASLNEEDHMYSVVYSFVKDCLLKPVSKEAISDIIFS